MVKKKNISIIGGGSSALILACSLDKNKYNISIYEKNAALGRKFLVAGKGGFNLTHSEDIRQFEKRYTPDAFMSPFINQFTNADLRNWLSEIGIETYVGSSKRVFPKKGTKPIEVLKAIETGLEKNNVSIYYNHTWCGWDDDKSLFTHHHETKSIQADVIVFALGGASWKVTGSDGTWTTYFKEKGIVINPFYPSNCAYKINWDETFINNNSGQALKNCEFSCGSLSKKGEAVITDFGIEGSGVYALSKAIREQLVKNNYAELTIDFKPELSLEKIKQRLDNKGHQSIKDVLEKNIRLTSTQINLLKLITSKEAYHDTHIVSTYIKSYPLQITDFASIDEAISTVGGISLDEVDETLQLKKIPNTYCIGELLDWDAPTGGYLLQACFSMGKSLADYLNRL